MDILSCLATAVLTPEWVVAQQVFKPSLNQPDRKKLLPLTQEPMGQIIPVHQIKESVSEQLTNEQNELQNRIEAIETRIFALEEEHSPTVFLEGEVRFGVTGAFGRELDNSTVLQASVELLLNASFTGQDILQVGLESGNSRELSFVGETTFEGRLDSPSDTDSDRFELSELNYAFPVSDRASLYLSTTGDDISEFNPFLEDDAISEFGIENPIHNLIEDVGVQLDYELTDEIGISLGYFSGNASEPEAGAGLFNGNDSAFAQLEIEPSDRFLMQSLQRGEPAQRAASLVIGIYLYIHRQRFQPGNRNRQLAIADKPRASGKRQLLRDRRLVCA